MDDAKESLSHDHIPVSVAPSTAYAGPSRSDPPSPDGKCLVFFFFEFVYLLIETFFFLLPFIKLVLRR